jgi:uncharacterized coiled-coil DUF342 family protein
MGQEKEYKAILQAILELSKQMKENQTGLIQLSRKVDNLSNRVDGLSNKFDDLSNRIDNLSSEVRSNKSELTERIELVEKNLGEKIDIMDSKVEVLSSGLLETRAEVLRLKRAK